MDFKLNDIVEIFDNFDGSTHGIFCDIARVTKITKTLIFVHLKGGSQQKFRTKDGFMVGYHWPILTRAIRLKNKRTRMRELIVKNLRLWGAMDYVWTGKGKINPNPIEAAEAYNQYLEKLDDEELLATYARVQEATNNTD